GDNVQRAKAAAAEYRAALHILTPRSPNWTPPVVTYSALTGNGVAEFWSKILEHRERMTRTGELAQARREQQVKWMLSMLDQRVNERLHTDAGLRARLPKIEARVAEGRLSAAMAVEEIAGALGL